MEIDKESGKMSLHAGDTLKLTVDQETMVLDALLKWEVYVRSMIRANDGKKFEKRWTDEMERLAPVLSFFQALNKNGASDDAGNFFTLTLCVGMPANDVAVLDALRESDDHFRDVTKMDESEVNDDCVASGNGSCGNGGAGDGAVTVPGADQLSADYCAVPSAVDGAGADCGSVADADASLIGVIDYRIFPVVCADGQGSSDEGLVKVVLSQVGIYEFTIREFRLYESEWKLAKVRKLGTGRLGPAWDEYQAYCRTFEPVADADCVALCADPAAVDSEEWRGMGFRSSDEFEAYCASDERNADGSLMTAREWLAVHRMSAAEPMPAEPAKSVVRNSRITEIVSLPDEPRDVFLERRCFVDTVCAADFGKNANGVFAMNPRGHGICADSTESGFAEGEKVAAELAAHGARYLTLPDAWLGRDAHEQSFYSLPVLWDPRLRSAWRALVAACRDDDESVGIVKPLFAEGRWAAYTFGQIVGRSDIPDLRCPDAMYLRCACHLAAALVGACTSTAVGGGLASVASLQGVETLCDTGFADQIIFRRSCVRDGNRVTLLITREMVFRELWNGADADKWHRRNVTVDAGDRSALMGMCYGWQCPEAYEGYAYMCALPCPICGASDSAAVSMMDSDKRHAKIYIAGIDAVPMAGLVGIHCLECGVTVPAEAYGADAGDDVFEKVVLPHFNRWNVCRNAGIFDAVKGGAE